MTAKWASGASWLMLASVSRLATSRELWVRVLAGAVDQVHERVCVVACAEELRARTDRPACAGARASAHSPASACT